MSQPRAAPRLRDQKIPRGASVDANDFTQLRPLMFSIAYRMTGSVGDAEDIVQEAVIRTYRAASQGTLVESPKAFVTTPPPRLAIDHLRSPRLRRETYVGTWLPEPLVTDPLARAPEPGP